MSVPHPIDRRQQVALVAGALAGHSDLGVEDSIAAGFQLVDEIDSAGWLVVDAESVDLAGALAAEFDRQTAGTDPFVTEPADVEPIEDVETANDFMVCAGPGAGQFGVMLHPTSMSRDQALRLAAWLSVLADPLGDEFDRVRAAVMAS